MKQAVIYLLDDEAEMLLLLSDIIEEENYQVESFQQAKLFFYTVRQFAKDSLMVLDLNMPEMDGIEVMRRLASMPNSPSLILISGHDTGVLHSAEKLARAHGLDIIASLNKPIELARFRQTIKGHYANIGGIKNARPASNAERWQPDDLLFAIKNQQMVLYYQPQVNLKSGELIGCEALIRWQHPKLGLIMPDSFIHVAEKQGWMRLLTGWVINEAVEQQQRWNIEHLYVPISVNVSADNITSLFLPEQIADLLASKKLNPTMLCLEVTESALMGELVTALDILTRLRLKGIGLSIDDFGTGYSSLSQLHRIPFAELKIDRGFVQPMLDDKEARAIVKTCIMLGQELKMQVVAEGVESEAHYELLKQLGCDIAQGYYLSKPVNADELLTYSRQLTS